MGMLVGVRPGSNELIVIDETTKEAKYVRTVKRTPEEQRGNKDHLAWVEIVAWNRGRGDQEADGDLPEFDVRSGPGRARTEEEKH
jgi:hypothetical protein